MAWTNVSKSTAAWTNITVPTIVYLWGASYDPWLSASYPWKKMNTYSEWKVGSKTTATWTNSSKS